MDASKLSQPVSDFLGGIGATIGVSELTVMIILVAALLLYIGQALMVGALARSKGYSFFGNFVLGLVFVLFALVFEAGRPVSYERECVMQDRLAMQTAKELYKLQRAREKAHTAAIPKAPVR